MALVYPRRLAFLNRGRCDVCGNQGHELVRTNTDHYFGWETCNDENCNQTIKDWYDRTSKTKDNLIQKYGEWVYVKRSSGVIESSWQIYSDAHQEEQGGPFWVRVKHKTRHLTKDIRLSDLEKWNVG